MVFCLFFVGCGLVCRCRCVLFVRIRSVGRLFCVDSVADGENNVFLSSALRYVCVHDCAGVAVLVLDGVDSAYLGHARIRMAPRLP